MPKRIETALLALAKVKPMQTWPYCLHHVGVPTHPFPYHHFCSRRTYLQMTLQEVIAIMKLKPHDIMWVMGRKGLTICSVGLWKGYNTRRTWLTFGVPLFSASSPLFVAPDSVDLLTCFEHYVGELKVAIIFWTIVYAQSNLMNSKVMNHNGDLSCWFNLSSHDFY